MDRKWGNSRYYLQNEEVEILLHHTAFNLVSIRFIKTSKECVVDYNFIKTSPTNEKYISIKLLQG